MSTITNNPTPSKAALAFAERILTGRSFIAETTGPSKEQVTFLAKAFDTALAEEQKGLREAAKAQIEHAKKVCAELLNEIRAYQGEGEFEEGSPTKDHCDLLKSVINYNAGHPVRFPSDEDRETLLRESLLEFVRVERSFGHIGQHKDSECADCKRVRKAETALSNGYLIQPAKLRTALAGEPVAGKEPGQQWCSVCGSWCYHNTMEHPLAERTALEQEGK